jgi:hypothetical protein
MKGRRYCPESPTGAHRAYYGARTNPEIVRAPCRDCQVEVVKGVDGSWYELVMPAWIPWAIGFVILAAFLATMFAWATTT